MSPDDDLSPGWRKFFDEMPPLGTEQEPYVAATNVRPIGPSDWPADWRERTVYGPEAFDEREALKFQKDVEDCGNE